MIVANLVVKKGKKDWNWKTKVVLWSKCRPMMELFRCKDLVKQENEWWYYEVDVKWLEQKVSLPVGSCNLALPLWEQGMLSCLHFHQKLISLFMLLFLKWVGIN